MQIGVLALQGAFIEHEKMLAQLGAESFEIRQPADMCRQMDGLIIPGGESTVQGKLLHDLGMFEPLHSKIAAGLPTFGTCTGLLLLAQNIANDERRHLGLMHITAVRNAYGRHLGSFHTVAPFAGLGNIPMTFIRAPYIESVGAGVSVLATVDGKIVAARQGNMLVTAFHPELTGNLTVHKYFLDMIKSGYIK